MKTVLPLRTLQLLLVTLAVCWQGIGHATTKELHWVGCGISKLGFMQELAKAYEKETGIRIILNGGGATKCCAK